MSHRLTDKTVLCNLAKMSSDCFQCSNALLFLRWNWLKEDESLSAWSWTSECGKWSLFWLCQAVLFYSLVSAPTMLFRSICQLWKALVRREWGQELRLSCLWSSIFIRTARFQKPLMGQKAVPYCLLSGSRKWDTLNRGYALGITSNGWTEFERHTLSHFSWSQHE